MRKLLTILTSLSLLSGPARASIFSVGLDKSQYTSDYAIGTVVVSVIFPESNGEIDPNIENWSDARQTQALGKIISGINWWTKQNPRSPLKFIFTSQTLSTPYEPITRPYYDEALWIPSLMSQLGYTGDRFESSRKYINALRNQYSADWGFVIFVVDSLNDTNGKFADGLFAYSYLGGPYTVMTYDNNGYGIGNMDVVAAHESGHIFNALDEYAGASSPNDYSHGYFPTINGNHFYSSTANDPDSIMRGGIRWGLDTWAKRMVGWEDDDGNGRDDILDPSPTITLSQTSSALSDGGVAFQGRATLNVLPRQFNSNGYGLTTDSIVRVEYRLASGAWSVATPSDGVFDSADEIFKVNLAPTSVPSAQSIRAQDVNLRVVTASSLFQGIPGATSIPAAGASSLASAHVFPNPYKPSEDSGKTGITIKGLTDKAKIQIFTANGDPVWEKINDSGSDNIPWNAKNSDGALVSSGIYLYLITDSSGQSKKGKLAILR